jgi:sugar lactone lactonase YvrE
METLVFSVPGFQKIGSIRHRFLAKDSVLFRNGETTLFDYPYYNGTPGQLNIFNGKPVEMALSHKGRFLWVPYYRRSFDRNASSPSAIAVIDTDSLTVVRVLPTGPIPKYIAISPDGTTAAITHWGDNTVVLLDIRADDPMAFRYTHHVVIESRLQIAGISGDRDAVCGFCLRGTVFTPDGRTLLVGRMSGGGIAGIDVNSGRYLGTASNIVSTPRHLVIGDAGRTLFVSGNASGRVGRYDLQRLVEAIRNANGTRVPGPGGSSLRVGPGARTIALSPDGRHLYVAVNNASHLATVDLATWLVVDETPVAPFAVGLAVSPDGELVVTTSQGRQGQGGGNSIGFYRKR